MVTEQTPQQFCVRWNSYQTNLQNAFPKLLTSEHFVDVTLACENEMLKCHKVVLSACSVYFEKLLLNNPCQHPIIFLKDMKFQEMHSLVDFMYKGEVNVTRDDLPSLLKSAEALQIRGLCGSDQLLNQQQFSDALSRAAASVASSVVKTDVKCETVAPSSDNNNDNKHPTNNHNNNNNNNNSCSNNHNSNNNNNSSSTESEGGQVQHNSDSNQLSDSSNDAPPQIVHPKKDESDVLEDDSYYEGDTELMDSEYVEDDVGDMSKTPDFAIANVSCQYDGRPGSATNRRIRRSDEELRRAAECITRGQTFQTVSNQFGIPISTIRFYMARKGILPRRKRGRACSTSAATTYSRSSSTGGTTDSLYVTASAAGAGLRRTPPNTTTTTSGYHAHQSGNTSPIGPPYHIVHYKLPELGVSKLK